MRVSTSIVLTAIAAAAFPALAAPTANDISSRNFDELAARDDAEVLARSAALEGGDLVARAGCGPGTQRGPKGCQPVRPRDFVDVEDLVARSGFDRKHQPAPKPFRPRPRDVFEGGDLVVRAGCGPGTQRGPKGCMPVRPRDFVDVEDLVAHSWTDKKHGTSRNWNPRDFDQVEDLVARAGCGPGTQRGPKGCQPVRPRDFVDVEDLVARSDFDRKHQPAPKPFRPRPRDLLDIEDLVAREDADLWARDDFQWWA